MNWLVCWARKTLAKWLREVANGLEEPFPKGFGVQGETTVSRRPLESQGRLVIPPESMILIQCDGCDRSALHVDVIAGPEIRMGPCCGTPGCCSVADNPVEWHAGPLIED